MKPEPQGVTAKTGISSTTRVHTPGEASDGVHLPVNDKHFVEFTQAGFYQPHTWSTIIKLSDSHETVIDIGAHVGFFSRELAKHFKQVVAFEPVPTNFACLVRNCESDNVIMVNTGIGKWGVRELYLHKSDNSGSWSEKQMDDVESGKAPITPLDCFAFSGRVSAIKLDVQGMETEALMSGERLLIKHKPLICVEVRSKDGYDPEPENYLRSLGARHVKTVGKDVFLKW